MSVPVRLCVVEVCWVCCVCAVCGLCAWFVGVVFVSFLFRSCVVRACGVCFAYCECVGLLGGVLFFMFFSLKNICIFRHFLFLS